MKLKLLSFVLLFLFVGCQDSVKKASTIVPISNILTDFPTASELEFTSFKKYPINVSIMSFVEIRDSLMWIFTQENDSAHFGCCYDLSTGTFMSRIAMKGHALHELQDINRSVIRRDSIDFYTSDLRTAKSYAISDMVNNVPMGERRCAIRQLPDSILGSALAILDNGNMLVSILPPLFEFERKVQSLSAINQASLALVTPKGIQSYQTIDYSSFDIPVVSGEERPFEDIIKMSYGVSDCCAKDNQTIALSVNHQFILYTFDLEKGKVINEKRYTKLQKAVSSDSHFSPMYTVNDYQLSVSRLASDEQHIFCMVEGCFTDEDKEQKRRQKALLVFDWQLNPVKRFNLSLGEQYSLDIPSQTIYRYQKGSEGLVLEKATLDW